MSAWIEVVVEGETFYMTPIQVLSFNKIDKDDSERRLAIANRIGYRTPPGHVVASPATQGMTTTGLTAAAPAPVEEVVEDESDDLSISD